MSNLIAWGDRQVPPEQYDVMATAKAILQRDYAYTHDMALAACLRGWDAGCRTDTAIVLREVGTPTREHY